MLLRNAQADVRPWYLKARTYKCKHHTNMSTIAIIILLLGGFFVFNIMRGRSSSPSSDYGSSDWLNNKLEAEDKADLAQEADREAEKRAARELVRQQEYAALERERKEAARKEAAEKAAAEKAAAAAAAKALPQFDQSSPGDGYLYTIRGHHAHHHAGKYLSMTTHERYGSIPTYTVFLSDTKVNHSTATSEWHFKWHAGKVRIVGRGTPHPGHNEGVALYKEGPHLKVNVLSGSNQHYWDINYKPGAHGTNRFQIAFACNFAGAANGTCEGEGNELVVYGPNSNAMRFENSKYDSPHASWWEIGDPKLGT